MDVVLARRIGELARTARVRLGRTQADVAETIGIGAEVYGRLERGAMLPSLGTLRKLSATLRVSATEFLAAEPPNSGEPPATATGPRADRYAERIVRLIGQLDKRQLRLVHDLVVELVRTDRRSGRRERGSPPKT